MKWYIADKDYVKYLKSIDGIVQDIEYDGTIKPYIGILMQVSDYNYYIPITSADKQYKQDKFNKMKNTVDFHKIIDSDENKLLAVLNINNMIPIPDEYVKRLYYTELEKYKKFDNDEAKQIYEDLLRKELKEINSISKILASKAKKITYAIH